MSACFHRTRSWRRRTRPSPPSCPRRSPSRPPAVRPPRPRRRRGRRPGGRPPAAPKRPASSPRRPRLAMFSDRSSTAALNRSVGGLGGAGEIVGIHQDGILDGGALGGRLVDGRAHARLQPADGGLEALDGRRRRAGQAVGLLLQRPLDIGALRRRRLDRGAQGALQLDDGLLDLLHDRRRRAGQPVGMQLHRAEQRLLDRLALGGGGGDGRAHARLQAAHGRLEALGGVRRDGSARRPAAAAPAGRRRSSTPPSRPWRP